MIDTEKCQYAVEECKQHGKGMIAKLHGVDDRQAALDLMQTMIAVSRKDLPELENGEYYWHDLIGLTVIDQQQTTLGTVKTILETGANDVLEVTGDRRRLIPWVNDIYVKSIDLASGVIQVDWQDDD